MTFIWPGSCSCFSRSSRSWSASTSGRSAGDGRAASATRACRSSTPPVPGSARRRRHLPFVLFAAALAALAFAVGRPVAIAAVPANQTTIVLVMDVSGSMCSDDIEPNRLIAAENAAAAFIEHQGPSTQIGIVAFSGFAQIVQTPTNDTAALIRRAPEPDDRPPDGAGQRHPGRHRRHRRGGSGDPAEHRRGPPGRRAAAGHARAPTRPTSSSP